jgi:osmotically-inducible protein OsmY
MIPLEDKWRMKWHGRCFYGGRRQKTKMRTKTSIAGAAITAALLLTTIPSHADSTAVVDLTSQLQSAGNIDGLTAIEVGGIVVLRGRTAEPAAAQRAGTLAQSLGYSRIANLIQVVAPPDDAAIERMAERRLAAHRALDGCSLRVDSQQGVVTVMGTVQHELQKDVAISLLRNIDGVRGVKANFEPQ